MIRLCKVYARGEERKFPGIRWLKTTERAEGAAALLIAEEELAEEFGEDWL